MTRGLVGLVATAALAAGCSTPVDAGDEPTTSRSLAAVVVDHLGDRLGDPYAGADGVAGVRDGTGRGVVAAADLRFGARDGDDRDNHLVVAVGTSFENHRASCEELGAQDDHLDGCADIEGGVLLWQLEEPEEDSGVVLVRVRKGDTDVAMTYLGPTVTGDPRELDMSISVEDMVEIADDPRVDVTTSTEAVEDGEALDWWQEG